MLLFSKERLCCHGGYVPISSHPVRNYFPRGGRGPINGGFKFLITPFSSLVENKRQEPSQRSFHWGFKVCRECRRGTDCMLSLWIIASNHTVVWVWVCACMLVCVWAQERYLKSMMGWTRAEPHLLKQQYFYCPLSHDANQFMREHVRCSSRRLLVCSPTKTLMHWCLFFFFVPFTNHNAS